MTIDADSLKRWLPWVLIALLALASAGGVPGGKVPIEADGFRVLIVEDIAARSKLPQSQKIIFSSPDVRDYLEKHCAKDGYRILPDGTNMEDADPSWQKAMKLERKSLPWIVVSAPPKGGTSEPLPKDVDSTLALLKKWGGP